MTEPSDTAAAPDTKTRAAYPHRRVARALRDLPSAVRFRLTIAIALIAAIAIAYTFVMARFDLGQGPEERRFGAAREEAAVQVYIEPVSIDASNYAIYLRINVSAGGAPEGRVALSSRDLILTIAHDQTTEQIDIRAGQLVPAANIEADLNGGDVTDYPFDAYTSALRFECFERGSAAPSDRPVLLPIQLTAWEGALGFTIRASDAPPRAPGEVQLHLAMRRKRALVFFALAEYLAMAVLAISALVVGTLVFAGIRRVEATTMGALGAVVFALPAVRNALPGAPPLGIHVDSVIFLWAEAAAVLSFALFVFAWARRGPKP